MRLVGFGVEKMKPNKVKRMLKQGKATVGCWDGFACADLAEILAYQGWDWIVFDGEHGPLGFETMQNLIMATAATETVPIVRVAWNDPVLIKRALDIGAYGVVIPWVNTKQEAINAVAACKYPPKGIRGCGPRRASNYGMDRDYLKQADDEVLVVVQIETVEAVRNLKEILSVPGVDVYFIGPADMAASHGLLGQLTHEKNLATIRKAVEMGKGSGVAPGMYSLSPDHVNQHIKEGFRFIAAGGAETFLQRGCKAVLNSIKK
jgi:2-keto-3-deoxy-L-rhamnonate aldolase RhmA